MAPVYNRLSARGRVVGQVSLSSAQASAFEAGERDLGHATREHVFPRSRPGRSVGHHSDDVDPSPPEDEPVVVPGLVDPAGLVHYANAVQPPDLAVEFPGVADARQQIEEVAAVRGRESGSVTAERSQSA